MLKRLFLSSKNVEWSGILSVDCRKRNRCEVTVGDMKRNQLFNILKVQHFKDTFPRFEPCISSQSCVILASNRAAKISDHVV